MTLNVKLVKIKNWKFHQIFFQIIFKKSVFNRLPAGSLGHFFKNSFIFVIGYLNKLVMYMSIEYLLMYGSNLVTFAS